MSVQLTHKEHKIALKNFPIIILTDNVMGEANIGSIYRLADAFNIEKIVFCGAPVNLNSNRLKRTARATFKSVSSEYFEDALEAFHKYISMDYTPYALELTGDSLSLDNLSFEKEEKILLVVGNERHGISQELLENIDNKMHITMFGINSSMNVAQATGIALYEITKTLTAFQQK